ncbi:MAG: DUF1905 domain-containing protein [Verrucomicrobia bacterium]|nr:DUF1905 domain-containing protein [Verrucomicrobiota bacterium]
MKRTFQTQLRTGGETGAWTVLLIPFKVAEVFGFEGRVPVKSTTNGFAFRTSISPQGDGTHCMMVNKAMQAGAKVKAGETVVVEMEPDIEPRVVPVPDDLKRPLARHAEAKAAFAKLSYSHRKEYVDWITEAKKLETRAARIEKTVQRLIEGKRKK